ncbi:MAG: flagellar basal body rod protein FlgC [Deltaproteobacteria bacterium]|nr:flagellar basal body rod protein FlgC [Deltaproteobacteria bacterium]
MFKNFDISASAMEAHRLRLTTISSNLANLSTTRTDRGEPYRRKDVIFEAVPLDANQDNTSTAVKVSNVIEDQRPFKNVYEPGHPDAGADGILRLPNINAVEEMVNMMAAVRAYEANAAAFNSAKEMMLKTLEIGG